MTTSTVYYTTALTATSCGSCGIPFGLPLNLYTDRLQDGGVFYCPNGHRLSFTETENARLTRGLQSEKDRAARLLAQRDQIEASLRATKGVVTKLRNRVTDGECPFCGQHLRDLARHVSRQHADESPAG